MPEDLKKIKEMATLQQQIHNPKLIDLGDKSEMHNMCAAARASRLPRPPRVQARSLRSRGLLPPADSPPPCAYPPAHVAGTGSHGQVPSAQSISFSSKVRCALAPSTVTNCRRCTARGTPRVREVPEAASRRLGKNGAGAHTRVSVSRAFYLRLELSRTWKCRARAAHLHSAQAAASAATPQTAPTAPRRISAAPARL